MSTFDDVARVADNVKGKPIAPWSRLSMSMTRSNSGWRAHFGRLEVVAVGVVHTSHADVYDSHHICAIVGAVGVRSTRRARVVGRWAFIMSGFDSARVNIFHHELMESMRGYLNRERRFFVLCVYERFEF